METLIGKMVQEFEDGKLSRRELIQGLQALAFAALAAPVSGALAATESKGFRTVGLDHISYQVADYRRTRDFYADLMGMGVRGDNGTSQCVLELGDALLIARNHRARAGETPDPNPKPRVDHIAYKIEDWDTDRVKAELERRGLTPRLDTGGDTPNYVSFHVEDPDGSDLQISGIAKPGDSQYEKS